MSGWPRVIEDADGTNLYVSVLAKDVLISIVTGWADVGVILTVDQCAALIAAITDADGVVTGEKA